MLMVSLIFLYNELP